MLCGVGWNNQTVVYRVCVETVGPCCRAPCSTSAKQSLPKWLRTKTMPTESATEGIAKRAHRNMIDNHKDTGNIHRPSVCFSFTVFCWSAIVSVL